jgi:hypothetical protein
MRLLPDYFFMKDLKFSALLPYLVTLLVFYVATLSYFYPELLDGKSLGQTDIVQFEGMSKRTVDYKRASGQEALWNDAMFSGLPDYLISTGVPEVALQLLKKVTMGFISIKTSAHLLFICFFCFWILLLTFRVNPYLALFGALAFGFNTYNIINIDAGHVTKTWAIAYSALVLAGFNLVFQKQYWLGLGVTALGLALQVGAPHYQITFYLVFVCVAWVVSEAYFSFREKQLPTFGKQLGVLVVASALAAGTSVGRLWMTQEYTPYSIRGVAQLKASSSPGQNDTGLDKEYAFSWSQGKMETFTLLIPGFYGGGSSEKLGKNSETAKFLQTAVRNGQLTQQQASQFLERVPMYWGDQPFTVGPIYAGAVVCFLFILAMFVLENRQRFWMLAAVVLTMMIAWGKNLEFFNYFLFDYIPGFNKFRSVSMALSLTMMVMLLAGILGVQQLLDKPLDRTLKLQFLYAVGSMLGLCLLIVVFSGMGSFQANTDAQVGDIASYLQEDRKGMMVGDAFRSMFLIALAAAALFMAAQKKLSWALAILITGVLMAGDLWLVGKRYIYEDKFTKNAVRNFYQQSPADAFILKDTDPHYRVFRIGSFDREAQTSYFHKSIGGYFAAKMMRYRDLIDRHLYPEQTLIIESLKAGKLPDFTQTPVLNMLNAKYIKYADEERGVILNRQALGHAWFVEEVLPVTSPDEEIDALNGLDPGKTAVVDINAFPMATQVFQTDSMASISLVSYSPREVTYRYNNAFKGVAVFPEIYYPKGWTAEINGQGAAILQVNYVLRALQLPAGEGQITFRFTPDSYEIGTKISSASGYLVGLIFLFSIGLAFYRKVKS